MPLLIQTEITPTTTIILDDPATLQALADEHGEVGPDGGTPVAITIPKITSDQTGLNYETRAGGTEFRFRTGTLKLTLRQELHVSRALSMCARTVWLQHENKHVVDNEKVMAKMDAELRANAEIDFALLHPTWQNRSQFQPMQTTIREVVGEVFVKLTSKAAKHQDSVAEYQSVERQIRIRCGHTIAKVLRKGDYGQGVDMVQVALNNNPPTILAPIKVDGVFGMKTEVRVREFQKNRALEPDGVVGPDTRAALGL